MEESLQNLIRIRGARTHNLKNVSVDIPRDRVVVITGPSGSGKSSLAIDTLSAEGQRQYFECLSLQSRQFFKQLPVADVDSIEGLPPTIFIDQASGYRNRRSTVGTLTEINDYLRLLMARCGQLHCLTCERPIVQHTPQQIEQWIARLPEKTRIVILAPITPSSAGDHREVIDAIRRERLVRVRVNGDLFDIDQVPPLDHNQVYSIEGVTDRLVVRPDIAQRLNEAIALADRLSDGKVIVSYLLETSSLREPAVVWIDQVFSMRYACATCNCVYAEIQPSLFSFNSPEGACPNCQGLGELEVKTLGEFAGQDGSDESNQPSDSPSENPNSSQPRKTLASQSRRRLTGTKGTESDQSKTETLASTFVIQPRTCFDCHGSRFSALARAVYLDGRNISELVQLSILRAIVYFDQLELEDTLRPAGNPLIKEISKRLAFLQQVGVGYLSLGRSVASLSGGEHQRVRLATSIGSGLTNVGYVLDEPSIGLHPRDNGRLIESIRRLQTSGNSVVLVEHDEATIRSADFVIDMGPQAGVHGGFIVAKGTPKEISNNPKSLTGQYLAGRKSVGLLARRRHLDLDNAIELEGASGRNLKSVKLSLPLNLFVAVTGVSGSGKSSLINQTLVPAVLNSIRGRLRFPSYSPVSGLPYTSITGADQIDSLVVIDQRPITQSTRGCPATVLGIFDPIRKIFSATKKAKQLGFGAGRFSFNSNAGWCPDCRGLGTKRIEMNFIPDFFVDCTSCRGRRFNLQTLQVKFNEQSIADVLEMSIERAQDFFDGFELIALPLKKLRDVGLGYLKLGQSTITLSGGEAQRLKLATELATRVRGNCLYVLDEPTTGLHFDDIRILLVGLNQLVGANNSLIVIEHNMDVIRSADWIVDLGPEGGDAGGEIIACGPPEKIRESPHSHTGRFL